MLQGVGRQQQSEEDVESTFEQSLDILQSRYGWTDDYILNLPYARFLDVIEIAADARSKEQYEEWRRAAFVGYQVYANQPRDKGKRPLGFDQWMSQSGIKQLRKERKRNDKQRQQAIEAAHQLDAELRSGKYKFGKSSL